MDSKQQVTHASQHEAGVPPVGEWRRLALRDPQTFVRQRQLPPTRTTSTPPTVPRILAPRANYYQF